MPKEPFPTLTARLAYLADRRLLSAEPEDHLRLDLLAHESAPKDRFKKKSALPKPSFKALKQFALTSALFFAVLFTITNAPAYTKVLKASLLNHENETAQATQLATLQKDPWTGERVLPELNSLSLNSGPIASGADGIYPLDLRPVSYENRIVVPSIEVNAPVMEPSLGLDALKSEDWNALEDQIRSSLLQGVVHYPGTADPGQTGNAFFTGHSSNVFWEQSPYNTVFALLPKIKEGDDIYITFDQVEYHYKVTSKTEVSPKEVSILKQGDTKELTLMTCTPVGTTLRRLVVKAELVED